MVNKEDNNFDNFKLTLDMVNKVITELYRSKTFDIISKLPRSHLILLKVLEMLYEDESTLNNRTGGGAGVGGGISYNKIL